MEDVPLDCGFIYFDFKVRVEACSVPVGELVSPQDILPMCVRHNGMYAGVVFIKCHFEEYGIVRPFSGLVVGTLYEWRG